MSFRNIYRSPLGILGKNSTRYPTPSKKKEKELIPTPPTYPRSESKNRDQVKKEITFMINLEDLLIIERNLAFTIDHFKDYSEVSYVCEELWDLTADNTLNEVNTLYRDENKRNIIRYTMVLHSAAIATVHYFVSEYNLTNEIASTLKSLLFNIHQGFLILTRFILSRVPFDTSNLWVQKLTQILKQKTLRKKNMNNLILLENYNKAISYCLYKICRKFIKNDDNTVKSLKFSLIEILGNTLINVYEARGLIEKAFGIKREVLKVNENIINPVISEACSDVYTLVLDLDETLVHYIETQGTGQYLSRPYAENFLKEMSKHYEIIVFTAAVQEYADWILNDLDSSGYIKYRLYRQHTIPAGTYFLKDLTCLGRDLSKTIIVDNVAENFQMQPENGILIKSWYDNPQDTALKELMPLLIEIVQTNVSDIRVALKIYRQQMLEQLSNGIENPILSLK
jgi:Dullard-like phosphatase family protein